MTYRRCPDNWLRLSVLMDSLADVAEDQQLSWIDNCAESPDIKSQLRELLVTAPPKDRFLCTPPNFVEAIFGDAKHFEQIRIELQPDRLIGAYQLIRELGQGGMGSVWLARRVDGKFKREVALKFPYAGPHQRQLIERLIRERDILAGLQHANIARLYDADVTESGQPFLVLEYIDGIAINEYCDQHCLDIRQRLLLFQQVLSAVRYAHARLAIHRDLKPSNILVTNDSVVHLLDFGIATFMDGDVVHETPLTQFGGRMLTPEYASPEQVDQRSITTATDIYSLGVLLFELLTGTSPYSWRREHRVQLEQAVINGDVIPADRIVITNQSASCRNTGVAQLHKMLRGELEKLLSKALKNKPDERYASVDAFAEDIARYLECKPILAQPDSHWYRIKKFTQRNRIVVGSSIAIVIALLTGTSAALWQAHVAKQQRDRAFSAAARSEAVSDFVQLMVTEVADGNQPITIQQLIERSQAIASKSYVNNVHQHAAILEMLGDYYLSLGLPSDANTVLSKALSMTGLGADPALRARILCLSAVAQLQLGNREVAQQQMAEGLANSNDTPEVTARCLETRAYFDLQDRHFESMLFDSKLAESELQKSGANKPDFEANLMAAIATAYSHLGQYADAERHYLNAIELLNNVGRDETTTAFQIENDIATFYAGNGNPLKALAYFDKAAEVAQKRGVGVAANDIAYSNRARALFTLARYDEAYSQFQMSFQVANQQHDIFPMVLAKEGIVDLLLATGKIEQAEKNIREIESMITPGLPTLEQRRQNLLMFKGLLAVKRKQFRDAIADFSSNIDFYDAHKMRDGGALRRLIMRGNTYYEMKDYESAKADGLRAYDLAKIMSSSDGYSFYTGEALLLLAKIEMKNHNTEAAHKWAIAASQQLLGSVGSDHPIFLEAKRLLDDV